MTQPDRANTLLLAAQLLSLGGTDSARDFAHRRGWIDADGHPTRLGLETLETLKNQDGHGFFRAVA